MNLLNLFEDDSRTPNPNYAEELAYQIFKAAPNLDTTGAADEVLDYAFDLAVNDLGRKRAHSLFAYDEDFDSDLVTAYLDLQMNKSAEDKKQVNEVDPRNFDSDEDYYAARNAPAKRRSAPSDYPYSQEDDDAYFREIFRKKREAAKKAEQDKGQGVAEGSEGSTEFYVYIGREGDGGWIGRISKDGGKWREEGGEGNKPHNWGTAYMSYLTPDEVMQWIRQDYRRHEVAGPFLDDAEAYEYAEQMGGLDESVAEADKKKEDDLEPQVKDVALQRAISRAKADFPTAGTGIEALAKDFMRSQDQDSKSFDQLRQAERKQDQMLGQIAKIDQEQEQEIKGLENQNSTLASRLQQLQNVNGELEKKLAAMSGRKAEKKSKTDTAITPAVAPTATTEPIAPVAKKAKTEPKKIAPTTSNAIGQMAKTLAPPAPSAAIDQMAQQLQPRQKELGFDEPTVLEPNIKSGRRINTSKAVDAPYRDVSVKMAKKLATDPAMRNQMYNADALRNLAGQEEMPLESDGKTSKTDHPEAKYSDKYQDMVARVGQKAREQEKSKPVDIKDLARRLAAIEASRKD